MTRVLESGGWLQFYCQFRTFRTSTPRHRRKLRALKWRCSIFPRRNHYKKLPFFFQHFRRHFFHVQSFVWCSFRFWFCFILYVFFGTVGGSSRFWFALLIVPWQYHYTTTSIFYWFFCTENKSERIFLNTKRRDHFQTKHRTQSIFRTLEIEISSTLNLVRFYGNRWFFYVCFHLKYQF